MQKKRFPAQMVVVENIRKMMKYDVESPGCSGQAVMDHVVCVY